MQNNQNNSTQRSYKSSKNFQTLGQTLIPMKDIQETVGYTNKSSLISKTIQYVRKQSELQKKVNIYEMVEQQRKKIYSHQNKLKLASIERETGHKEVLRSVRDREEEVKEMRKKKMEDKLTMHNERLKNIKKEKLDKNVDGIMDLFRRLGEAKEEYIEIPIDISVPQMQPKASLNEIKEVAEQDKGLFSLTEYQIEKKKDTKKKKETTNPFELYGTKEITDKISDMTKNNQPIKFPNFGIERTPIYQLQYSKGQQNQNKKNDFYTRLSQGDFIYQGHTKKLNLKNMYDELDYLKAYKPRIEKVDPENRNLLSHKLWKALDDAAILWGHRKPNFNKKRNMSSDSKNSFEKSIENILDDEEQEKAPKKLETKSRSAGRFLYTKQHRKVKLF